MHRSINRTIVCLSFFAYSRVDWSHVFELVFHLNLFMIHSVVFIDSPQWWFALETSHQLSHFGLNTVTLPGLFLNC